ncbi:hypothetical protein ACA910_020574 [Epithemia clementina (nom. ined.)]
MPTNKNNHFHVGSQALIKKGLVPAIIVGVTGRHQWVVEVVDDCGVKNGVQLTKTSQQIQKLKVDERFPGAAFDTGDGGHEEQGVQNNGGVGGGGSNEDDGAL